MEGFFNGNTIVVKFNGTIENLNKELEKIINILGVRNYYSSDINLIKEKIIPNFNDYSKFSRVYFKTIILNNTSVMEINLYFYEYYSNRNNSNNPLYNWFFTKILLFILLLLFIISIIITIYSYVFNLDLFNHLFIVFA